MNAEHDALCQIPVRMAQAVAPLLPHVDRSRYLRFLDQMYHYTRHSGARLQAAAAAAPEGPLRDAFAALAAEEAEHYLLAAADLRRSGRAPSAEPPAEVHAFATAWAGLSGDSWAQAGALAALEGVARHLVGPAMAALQQLKLRPDEASFVLVHLRADDAHGDTCMALCQRGADAGHGDSIRRGAELAAAAWVAMHRASLGSDLSGAAPSSPEYGT